MEKNCNHQIVAGLNPDDSNIEFVGIKATKEVIWIQNGTSQYFGTLPKFYYKILKKAYRSDLAAIRDLEGLGDLPRQVELYTYYMYGSMDNMPDIKNGKLSPSENFRHSVDCISLGWETKKMTIDGVELKPRDLVILDAIGEDYPDKVIADLLGVAMSTFNIHKHSLMTRTNCATKVALAIKAQTQNILIS